MSVKLLSWNVRGLNRFDKRLQIRNLLRMWKADMVCLQETKLSGLLEELFEAFGVVRILIGCTWVPKVLLEVFY